jgi:hypothetical protein
VLQSWIRLVASCDSRAVRAKTGPTKTQHPFRNQEKVTSEGQETGQNLNLCNFFTVLVDSTNHTHFHSSPPRRKTAVLQHWSMLLVASP